MSNMIDEFLGWVVGYKHLQGEHSQASHGGGGGSGGDKKSRQYSKTPEGRNQKMADISEGDAISHGGKDWDVLAVKKIGGKQNRHDVTVKPHGEPRRKTVQGAGLNKGKTIEIDQSRVITLYNTGGDYSADRFDFK